jgi:hypothetical protein
MGQNIGSIIDDLLSKDFSEITADEILKIISGGQDLNIPYEDLQSEEGFEKELKKNQEEVNSIIESLKPGPPPISLDKIEDLSCEYQGDDLYSVILLETIKIEDPKLYNSLLKSEEYKDNKPISEKELGVKVNSGTDLGFSKKIPSDGIIKFLKKSNPEFLEKTNERIFDNIDPLVLGKPSNSGSKKKRKMDVLGFKIPLDFIMNGTQIVHVKIGGDELSIDGALEKINGLLKKQNNNSNPCDFQEEINISSERIDGFDSNFFPDGDDPIIDDDCLPGVPEDPITGDPISTKDNFDSILEEFCDPPPFEFRNEEGAEPEPSEVDIDAIDSCISSALEKGKKLEEDIKVLARWQMIEKNLEEILYHYEPIYEYQKSLYENWLNRVPKDEGSDPSNFGLGAQILAYREQIISYEEELRIEEQRYENEVNTFLENNPIFTPDLFLLTVLDTELEDSELEILFNNQIGDDLSPVAYNESTQSWPVLDGIIAFRENLEDIRSVMITRNFIDIIRNKINDTNSLLISSINLLSDRLEKTISISDVEKAFIPSNTSSSDIYGQGTDSLIKNERVFKSPAFIALTLDNYTYDSYGYDFIKALEDFSVRYKTNFKKSLGELQFKLSFMSDYGSPLPYKRSKKPAPISFKGESKEPLVEVSEPDEQKIKIGNEYAGNGGLLSGQNSDYLKSYQFLEIKNLKNNEQDVAKFYDFIEKIIKTNKSKSSIISDIVKDRGILYGHLIEKSASNWLFFTSQERGDNDARDPSKSRPSSFTPEGDPSPVFTEFYGNFKPKWNAKYLENKKNYIDPAMKDLKNKAKKAGEGLGNTLPLSDVIGIRLLENYLDVKRKYEQVKETILLASQKISEINDSVSPENIEKRFSDVKCAGSQIPGEEDKENCPPACCGEPGSDFKTPNYLLSSPPSSDCPTMFQRCWWKQFCKDLTKVGLLPYPNGLPPIENSSFFLSGGPSVRLGLKYWPVGYLPPAFIPIPFANPIDGNPFIRLPLPMIWTIVPPILIPLPFNLGLLVIFIPFIGGFMPTPLVYIKEFITGSSFFLSGLRGPRFIPRKSDPIIRDPLEKIKQALTFGVPDKLIPLPGFGLDNLDLPSRVLGDINGNVSKIFDSVPPPGNIQQLRGVQEKEREIKRKINEKERDYKNKSALLDLPQPDITSETESLNLIIAERKEALKNIIKEYLEKSIPDPKSIYFPKDKDKLKIDTPGIIRSLRILKEMRASFVPIECPNYIDLKEEMKEVLKLMRIVCPPKYLLDNFEVANSSKIFLRERKDPRLMNEEEFEDLVNIIRTTSMIITKVILWGNRFSIIKKVRSGAFHLVENEYEGVFKFPEIKITNSAPNTLNFLKRKNPIIEAMKFRIMEGLSTIEYTKEDFSRYVRYEGEDPILVIRVKDLKRLVSKKLGLSKIGQFDPVRPLDIEEPLISNFPYPKGPLSCLGALNGGFGTAVAAFELSTVFPLKQDQLTQTPGLGGIIQITIPGSQIKSFLAESLLKSLDNGGLEKAFPEINDINSPMFINMNPADIQKMTKTLTLDLINPNSPNVPPFLNVLRVPVFPPSRPTDIIEQGLIGLGAPSAARIPYSLFWKYFKGVPKTPLSDLLVLPKVTASSELLSKIPWPLAVLIGRNVLNILNPIIMNDDHPVWRRMSLRNTYYVVYIDEFLRSAADVSGSFKFFFGSADPVYPIPELPSELKKAFNIKKY